MIRIRGTCNLARFNHPQGNRGVVYVKPGVVEVRDIAYPVLALPEQNNRKCNHGVIIKCLATNICGSDQV